jgi:hypothetical protein
VGFITLTPEVMVVPESDSSAAAREERVKRAISSVSRHLAMNDMTGPNTRRVP